MKRIRLKHIMEYESMLREQNNDYEMYLRLTDAIRLKDVQEVIYLLNNGAPANGIGEDRTLPIMVAAEYGNIDIIEILLKHGVSVDSVNKWKFTPLHIAAYKGFCDCCEFLIEKGATVDAKNQNEETPLFQAAEWGKIDCIKSLLKYNANIDEPDIHGDTPLMQAILNGKIDTAKFLISRNANIEAKNKGDETALLRAIRLGYEEIVRFLVENKAKLTYNLNSLRSNSPLGMAVDKKYTSMARILIEGGVDPLEKFKSYSDAIKFFGDDAMWLAEYLPPGIERQNLLRSGKTKNLFGI